MKRIRIVALVVGCLLLRPGVGLQLGGGGLASVYAFGRDASGYLTASSMSVQSPTAAITIENLPMTAGVHPPAWLVKGLQADVRLRVTAAGGHRPVFVGVAWTAQAAGAGTQNLSWRVTDAAWAVVVMNADGSPGVTADATAGLRAGFLLAFALVLLAAGAVTTAGAVALVVFGVRGRRGGGGAAAVVTSTVRRGAISPAPCRRSPARR